MVLGRPLGRFLVGVARICLTDLPWDIEVARHSGLYEFHICALFRQVSSRERFTNIQTLALELRIVFLQSLAKILDSR